MSPRPPWVLSERVSERPVLTRDTPAGGAEEIGADASVTKPFELDDLFITVTQLGAPPS
jgi:hypothetical protein